MSLKPSRFLDPKTDVIFKKIFGNNPDLIKSFLNGVLPLPDDGLIAEIEYLTPEQTPRIPTMKNTIVDVKCKDEKGRIFIVEMQLHWSDSFMKRLLFGTSKAYVQQINKGENYSSLCPVYGLGIINYTFDHQSNEWFHHYKTVNVKNPEKTLEGLELIFVELPKFSPQTFTHRKLGTLWLRFLKELDEHFIDIPQEFLNNPELSKAMELSQEAALSPQELEDYDRYWDAIRVESTIKSDALQLGIKEGKQLGIEEGKQLGIEEGKQLGIEEGKQLGIEEGKQLGIEKGKIIAQKEMAQKLLAEGMDKTKIATLLGVDVSDLF